MVKTPKTRHSKPKREPVTIDLDPASVSRVSEAPEGASEKEAEGATEAGAAGTEPPLEQSIAAEQPGSEGEGDEEAAQPQSFTGPAPESEGDGQQNSANAEDTPAHAEAPSPAPDAGERPARGGGRGKAFAAGLVGGIAALLLAGGLQWAGVLPAPVPADDGEDQAFAALRQEVNTLQSRLSELRDAQRPPTDVSEQVAQRLNALEDDVAGLQDTVSGLQSAVSSGDAGRNTGLETLETRVSELESRISELAQTTTEAAAGEDLSSRLAALAQDVEAVSKAAEAASASAKANAEQMNTLQSRLDEFSQRVDRSGNQRFAPVLAAMVLDSAIRRGAPFEKELESYAAIAKDTALVEQLRPYAAEGLPTRAEIAAQASDAADRMIRAVSSADENAGVVDRLIASARSLVVVRPVGEAEGNGVAAVAARIETAVRRGDYGAALEEYQSLPQKAKSATAGFADRLRALDAADRIVEQALSEALKSA